VIAHGLEILQRHPRFWRLFRPTIGVNVTAPYLSDAPVETLRSFALIEIDVFCNEGVPKIERGVDDEPAGVPNEKGAFSIHNLKPGRYRIDIQMPVENWFLKSM